MIITPYYSRSHRTTDDRCRRARYWWGHYGGRGIEAVSGKYEPAFGTAVHAGLGALYLGKTLEEAVREAVDPVRALLADSDGEGEPSQHLHEQLTLAEMLVRGYQRLILPSDLEQYDVVAVEREFAYPHDGLVLGAKPDLILRRKFDGGLVYREFKTSKLNGQRYFESFQKSPQLMAGGLVVEATLGEPIVECQVQALYKGYEYEGNWSSALVYGWVKAGQPGLIPDEYAGKRPKSWKGWSKVPVWEFGPERWLECCPQEELSAQFPLSPPIYPDQEQVQTWIRQNALREQEIRGALQRMERQPSMRQLLMDQVFPQNFDACSPPIGFGCQFCDACWLKHVGEDPVGSGLYRWREFHHETERKVWELKQAEANEEARAEQGGCL